MKKESLFNNPSVEHPRQGLGGMNQCKCVRSWGVHGGDIQLSQGVNSSTRENKGTDREIPSIALGKCEFQLSYS